MKDRYFFSLRRLLVTLCLIMVSWETFAAQYQTKALQIRLRDPVNPVAQPARQEEKSALQVSLTPLQTEFQVNESIRFNVKANRPFYMYLFSIDDQHDEAILLLPHRLHQGNRYPASQTMLVPNVNIEFYAEHAGKEKLMMIASENYFDWDTSGYTEASVFLKTPLSHVKKQLKKLNVRPAGTATSIPHRPDDIFLKEVMIDIVNATPELDPVVQRIETIVSHSTPADSPSNNTTLSTITSTRLPTQVESQTILNNTIVVSSPVTKPGIAVPTSSHLNTYIHTDKSHYQLGEPVKIFYGANRPGWLHLMSYDGKNIISQSTSKVEASQVQELQAMASLPTGLTQIAAIFTANSRLPSKDSIQALFRPGKAKGLINHKEDQMVFSKTHFYVNE